MSRDTANFNHAGAFNYGGGEPFAAIPGFPSLPDPLLFQSVLPTNQTHPFLANNHVSMPLGANFFKNSSFGNSSMPTVVNNTVPFLGMGGLPAPGNYRNIPTAAQTFGVAGTSNAAFMDPIQSLQTQAALFYSQPAASTTMPQYNHLHQQQQQHQPSAMPRSQSELLIKRPPSSLANHPTVYNHTPSPAPTPIQSSLGNYHHHHHSAGQHSQAYHTPSPAGSNSMHNSLDSSSYDPLSSSARGNFGLNTLLGETNMFQSVLDDAFCPPSNVNSLNFDGPTLASANLDHVVDHSELRETSFGHDFNILDDISVENQLLLDDAFLGQPEPSQLLHSALEFGAPPSGNEDVSLTSQMQDLPPHHQQQISPSLVTVADGSAGVHATPKLREKIKMRKERELQEIDLAMQRHLSMVAEKNEQRNNNNSGMFGGVDEVGPGSADAYFTPIQPSVLPQVDPLAAAGLAIGPTSAPKAMAPLSPVRFSPVRFSPLSDRGSPDDTKLHFADTSTMVYVPPPEDGLPKSKAQKKPKVPIYKQAKAMSLHSPTRPVVKKLLVDNNSRTTLNGGSTTVNTSVLDESPYCFVDDEVAVIGTGDPLTPTKDDLLKEKTLQEQVQRKLLEISSLHPELKITSSKRAKSEKMPILLGGAQNGGAVSDLWKHVVPKKRPAAPSQNGGDAPSTSGLSGNMQQSPGAPAAVMLANSVASLKVSDIFKAFASDKKPNITGFVRTEVIRDDSPPRGPGGLVSLAKCTTETTQSFVTSIVDSVISELCADRDALKLKEPLPVPGVSCSPAAAVLKNGTALVDHSDSIDEAIRAILPQKIEPLSLHPPESSSSYEPSYEESLPLKFEHIKTESVKPNLIVRISKLHLHHKKKKKHKHSKHHRPDSAALPLQESVKIKEEPLDIDEYSSALVICEDEPSPTLALAASNLVKQEVGESPDDVIENFLKRHKKKHKKRKHKHRSRDRLAILDNGEEEADEEVPQSPEEPEEDPSDLSWTPSGLRELPKRHAKKARLLANSGQAGRALRVTKPQLATPHSQKSSVASTCSSRHHSDRNETPLPMDLQLIAPAPLPTPSRVTAFQKGAFVVAKDDVGKEDAPLWRVDNQNLLQKFTLDKEKSSSYVYVGTAVYSGWAQEHADRYLQVSVRLLEQTRATCVVQLDNALSELVPAVATEILSEETCALSPPECDQHGHGPRGTPQPFQPLSDAFDTYLHVLVLHCLTGSFLSQVHHDWRLLRHVSEIESINLEKKGLLVGASGPWLQSFRETIEWYPFLNVTESEESASLPCQACERKYVESCVQVFGDPYNQDSLEPTGHKLRPSGSPVPSQEFHVCKTCAELASSYHKLFHMKYTLFKQCDDKVQSILTEHGTDVEASFVTEKCVRNRTWVHSAVQEFIDLWHSIS